MKFRLDKTELHARIRAVYDRLNAAGVPWDAAFIFSRVNQYYLTGSMQDGVFVLRADGAYQYFVYRSYARAQQECLIDEVSPMASYRDVAAFTGDTLTAAFIDEDVATLSVLGRLKKHVQLSQLYPLDRILQQVRAVKSPYELERIRESGRLHSILLDEVVPGLLRAGMSEAELTADIYREMIRLGYHGVSRFNMFQTEMVVGQVGFGENSIYPTSFNGPGGMKGMGAYVSIVGDRDRSLRQGDLMFVDIGFGFEGYHSDRTQVYLFGAEPPAEAAALHEACRDVQRRAAEMLRPGTLPADIYAATVECLPAAFRENFMGMGRDQVRFLGHGVGLHIDEYPVIAPGFTEPLQAGMVIALEPKKSLAGFGIVGVEDTYLVTENGGKCLTGGERGITVVPCK